MSDAPLHVFVSHISGKNATVSIYSDRIEWLQPRGVSADKLMAGIMTVGLPTLATGLKGGKTGTEFIPIKSISSVTTKQDGMSNTLVQVITSGNTIDFRVSHSEADKVRQVLQSLILGTHPSQAASTAPPVTEVSAPAPVYVPDRATVVAEAAHVFWTGLRHDRTFSPRVQAERAYYVGGPSVEVLLAKILVDRGLSSE